MLRIGYSTGAIAKSDFRLALPVKIEAYKGVIKCQFLKK